MPKFYHLHVHSMFSLLDGLAKIDQLVAKAKEFDMSALALTDHGVMYGAVEFYKKCKEAGIKPIIGFETYLAPRTLYDKQSKIDTRPSHLVLLAKNEEGYKNLIKLTSIAHLEGYYYKPRVDKNALRKHAKGLIALTACLQGEIPSLLAARNFEAAKKIALEYQEIFGKDNFYLELQHHPNIPEQKLANKGMIELSKATGAPLVATNDVHYLNPQDQEAHEILLCVQTGRTYDDPKRLSMKEEDFSFKSREEMIQAFKEIPEAILNTEKIARMCNLEIELGKFVLPKYPLPRDETDDSYLEKLARAGLKERFGGRINQEVQGRLKEELGVIKRCGFAPYFLIVADFVNWAREREIRKGPGRGSAAGSLVSYLLRITDIDPLKYDLLFERFLSKEGERVAPPDIDLDFAEDRREEVIEYITHKYGEKRVAQIITFGTMAARASVRDVARALGMPYAEADTIAKLIPFGTSLKEALEVSPLLIERYQREPEVTKLIDLAMQLEGVARHASTHAAGVVIGKEDLTERVPLQRETGKEENIITQYSMYDLEELGMLKVDILGLANLTIINNTLRIVRKTQNKEIDIARVPLDDSKVYQLLSKGQTAAVFQLESEGMRKWLQELKPTGFSDIIAMIALYRPGPMAWISDYVASKHGRTPNYVHPKLEPILKSTYGVPIYQEQVMQIARDLAGFSYSEADVLRKAIGKKIKKLLMSQKDKFIEGCQKNGIHQEAAHEIFQFIEPFARYSFNKSHSTCYAFIAYWTAYLKSYFPSEYMAAFLTNEQTDFDKLALAIAECERIKIKVLLPDVNESWPEFAVVSETNNIRFGLAAIKNVGNKAAELMVEERKKRGPYRSLGDFVERTGPGILNKKILESLAKAGALDRFEERTKILAGVEQILKAISSVRKDITSAQLGLFGGEVAKRLSSSFSLPEVAPASKNQKLNWEKELLGMYLSEHPLDDHKHIWENGEIRTISSLDSSLIGQRAEIAGIISKIQRIRTKNGSEMAFLKVEDISGPIEAVVFPKVLVKKSDLIMKDKMVKIKGMINERDNTIKIIVDDIDDVLKRASVSLFLTIPEKIDKDALKIVKQIISEHQGSTPLYLRIPQDGNWKEIRVKSKVKISDILIRKLNSILGTESVEVKSH